MDKADLSNLGWELSSKLSQQKTKTLQLSCVRNRGAHRGVVLLSWGDENPPCSEGEGGEGFILR